MTTQRFGMMVMAALAGVLAGCASSSETGDSWTRSYLSPPDVVFNAVVEVLEADGYLVEANREAGRISAVPSRSNRGLGPSLAVRVVEKAERVLVDVQTRSGVNDATTRGSQIDTMMAVFFHELELRLQGFKD
jgi:hypothetical protein